MNSLISLPEEASTVLKGIYSNEAAPKQGSHRLPSQRRLHGKETFDFLIGRGSAGMEFINFLTGGGFTVREFINFLIGAASNAATS